MKILITICARGGSKGIPGKNIKMINGRPLIAYTIETAQKLARVLDVDITLSSEDEGIIACASDFDLNTKYRRPVELATDHAGKLDVIRDVMNYEEVSRDCTYDFVIDLDVTSPLRTVDDLISAIDILKSTEEAVNLFSVNKAHKNPYFNMVEQKEDGYYGLSKKGNFLTRQSSPAVYEINASFYIFKRRYFDAYNTAVTPFSLVYVMNHLCFDMDELSDFDYMEYLLTHDKLNFRL